MAQQIKTGRGGWIEADQNLIQAQCKICYLQLDGGRHYPMMVCSSQHFLCLACFTHLSKNAQFLQCPFCKRTTDVDNVVKFRYALTACAKYQELKEKYVRLLDRMNAEVGMGKEKEYGQTLTELQKNVNSLKARLKASEERNKVLMGEMDLQKDRYLMFEREIIECKHNDIIIKNKMTMLEYQLKILQKEKNSLGEKWAQSKNQLQNCGYVIKELTDQNESLREELSKLGKGRGEMNIERQFKRQGSELCPQMEGEGSDVSQHLFLAKKKSKSQYRIKTEMPSSMTNIQMSTPTAKKVTTARKGEKNKTKEKDEYMKFVQKKIHKMFKF